MSFRFPCYSKALSHDTKLLRCFDIGRHTTLSLAVDKLPVFDVGLWNFLYHFCSVNIIYTQSFKHDEKKCWEV